jgi:short-subunit dehydrogenase
MAKGLSGKVAWITGASSGIGRAIAIEAARRGARLILSGRRKDALGELRAECLSLGASGAEVLAFDLEDRSARVMACSQAPALLGPIDVLILNAGMSQRSSFLDTAPDVFDRVMNLDFSAQVDMARRCLPAMAERGSGCLVGISSFVGLAGMPLRPAYSAAKHAMAGLFQNLRAELVGSGVRVVTVFPGYVKTGVGRNALAGDGRAMEVEDPRIEGGFEPAPVARRILRAAVGGRVEIKVAFGFEQWLALLLSRFAPSLFAKMTARYAGLGARAPKPS